MTQTTYKIKPAAGYLVVEPISQDEYNKTELATLKNEREHVATGKVIAVSEFAGVYENYGFQFSTDCKVGDTISYIQYSEFPIKLNGQELHQIRFDKVTGTIVEEN